MSEFKMIKKIYARLGDEASREIFLSRLQFSLSGDLSAINEMVDREMARYGDLDVMNNLLDWIEKGSGEIVLFGAGVAGKQILSVLKRHGIEIAYIADNNECLWGSCKSNVKIVSPDNISKSSRVIIGVNKYEKDIFKQLVDMGVFEANIFMTDRLWWLGSEKQYFDSDIMIVSDEEIFVDGGALDGEDTLSFFEWCGIHNGKSYLFEPAPCNQKKLEQLIGENNEVQCIQAGLWSEDTELRFRSGMPQSGKICEDGDAVIKVTSIDNVLDGAPATFIKMDIEGSELQALVGAEETIKKYKPKLAVCVYHKPEDIIDIPKKILEMNPEYKLYLRHYSYVNTETVLYAV